MMKLVKNIAVVGSLAICIGVFANNVQDKFINSEIVSLEETLERFYIIQRLDPLMRLLEITPEHFWIFPTPTLEERGMEYDGCNFNNPHILALVTSIDAQRSIKPIFHMWEELKRYKYLHDIKLIKEFTQVLFIVTRYSFKTQLPLTFEDKVAIKNVYSLDAIDTLPLEQVLDVLDIIIEDMPAFLEKYELQSNLTWKEWLRKYWPVAPIAIAAFILKVYMSYLEQHKSAPIQVPATQIPASENTTGNIEDRVTYTD